MDDACLTSCGNRVPGSTCNSHGPHSFMGQDLVYLCGAIPWHPSLTKRMMKLSVSSHPLEKGFLLQEDWPRWSAESSARGGGARRGCHRLGVKPELSQGVEERHIRAAGEEGSREENKWDSGRSCRGPRMEVFFSESRNGTACAVGQDCSEIEPREPKLSQGSHPVWSPAYCELEMRNGNSISHSCAGRLPGHHSLERGLRI